MYKFTFLGVGATEIIMLSTMLIFMAFALKILFSKKPIDFVWIVLILGFPLLGSVVYLIKHYINKLDSVVYLIKHYINKLGSVK
ncbi:hypothetical protein SAMN06265350_10177 [Solitalea koreensis]|uniref:Phospholipase_D-nuclease N-terminal n=1 Tax=Solitalea koreensis TaxID=543615 RepID=A0A521ADQ9_9SPHI|nr:hypothetical protein SAMN06265350_10177 [Solitalea koreensis]